MLKSTGAPRELVEVSKSAPSGKPRSFVTLDFLRGVASLPVIYYHTSPLFGHKVFLFPEGEMAVDFFFMLSGFVMTYVYQERLDSGWSTKTFFLTRVLRLYPMYILGTVLGLAFTLLWAHFGRLEVPAGTLALLMVLGALFLPILPSPVPPALPRDLSAMYPLDVPAWSLFYELVANLLHAVALRRRSTRFLAILVAIVTILLLPLHAIGAGFRREDYLPAFCRIAFGYPLGMILFRLWRSGRMRIKLPVPVIALLLLAVMAVPAPKAWLALYEFAIVVFVLPVLLLAGANTQPAGAMIPVSRWLGALSYPLYILHVPLSKFFGQIWPKLLKHRAEDAAPWSGLVFLLLLMPTAYWIGELYDPEVRKILHRRLMRRPA